MILVTGHKGFIGRKLIQFLDNVQGFDFGDEMGSGYEGIIHLAAISRVSHAEAYPIACLESNIILTARLIELKPQWFILVSTEGFADNIYGLSKRFAEDYCAFMGYRYNVKLKIVRFPVVYGEGDSATKLIPSVRNGGTINDGALPITTLHVDEAVDEIITQIGFLKKRKIIQTKQELRHVAASY